MQRIVVLLLMLAAACGGASSNALSAQPWQDEGRLSQTVYYEGGNWWLSPAPPEVKPRLTPATVWQAASDPSRNAAADAPRKSQSPKKPTVQFALFTDKYMGTQRSDGTTELRYVNVPVWAVIVYDVPTRSAGGHSMTAENIQHVVTLVRDSDGVPIMSILTQPPTTTPPTPLPDGPRAE